MSKVCPNCGKSSDGKFCPYCGQDLAHSQSNLQQTDNTADTDETVIYSADQNTGEQPVPSPEWAGNPWFSKTGDNKTEASPEEPAASSSSQTSSPDPAAESSRSVQPDFPDTSSQNYQNTYSGQPNTEWRNEQMNWQEKGGNSFFSGTMGSYQPQGMQIPREYQPISMWGYFGYSLLFSIPCVGFVFLCIFAFGGTVNLNLKNYARSYFCVYIIGIILAVIMWFTLFAAAFAHGSYYYRYW